MVTHLIYVGVILLLSIFAWLYRAKLLNDGEKLVHSLTVYGTQLDSSLLDKLHALENGGHLAAGTTAQVIRSQVSNPVPNGSQPSTTATATA